MGDGVLKAATAVAATSMGSQLDLSDTRVRVHPVTHELPPDVQSGIGKIVSLWAYEEWLLTGIAVRLMNTGRKKGRKDLSGRADDALQAIKCAYVLAKEREPQLLSHIVQQVSDLADLRNTVGHGIWVHDQNTGRLSLQRISGASVVDGKDVARKDTPEAVDATPEWFERGCERIIVCIKDTEKFAEVVEALIAAKG